MSDVERVERLECLNKIAMNTINELNVQLRKTFCCNESSDDQLPTNGKQILQELTSLEVQNKKILVDVRNYKISGKS